MTNTAVEIQNLTKEFEGREFLQNWSLTIINGMTILISIHMLTEVEYIADVVRSYKRKRCTCSGYFLEQKAISEWIRGQIVIKEND